MWCALRAFIKTSCTTAYPLLGCTTCIVRAGIVRDDQEWFPENALLPILLYRSTWAKFPEIRKFPEDWHLCLMCIAAQTQETFNSSLFNYKLDSARSHTIINKKWNIHHSFLCSLWSLQMTLSDRTKIELRVCAVFDSFPIIYLELFIELINKIQYNYILTIIPVKVFRTITHNTYIIARDVLYTHHMECPPCVLCMNKTRPRNFCRDNIIIVSWPKYSQNYAQIYIVIVWNNNPWSWWDADTAAVRRKVTQFCG